MDEDSIPNNSWSNENAYVKSSENSGFNGVDKKNRLRYYFPIFFLFTLTLLNNIFIDFTPLHSNILGTTS